MYKQKKAEPWNMEDLEQETLQVMLNKEVAGSDLKLATAWQIAWQRFPEALNACNIASLYKHKRSRKDFMQYRGVFRVS